MEVFVQGKDHPFQHLNLSGPNMHPSGFPDGGFDFFAVQRLSGEIALKIQNEMTYPGQVKITVIRETRSVAYAK